MPNMVSVLPSHLAESSTVTEMSYISNNLRTFLKYSICQKGYQYTSPLFPRLPRIQPTYVESNIMSGIRLDLLRDSS